MSETKKVTLPSGLVVEFRRPGPFTDALAVGGVPALASRPLSEFTSLTEGEQDEVVSRTLGAATADLVFAAAKFCICSIRPRFTIKTPPERGARHLDTLSKADFDAIISEFSAFDRSREEAEVLLPLSETGTPSSSFTQSEEPTEAVPLPSLVTS